MNPPAIALTVDFEGGIEELPARTTTLLALFDSFDVKATFFVLGEIAEKLPSLVREISNCGHEIGFHGYRHVPLSNLSLSCFRAELVEWRSRLECLTQRSVLGFRAPFFSLQANTVWALAQLEEAGFRYDSSIYPGLTDRFSWRAAPQQPIRTSSGFVLFPVPVLSRALPVGFSGGGYLRLLPWLVVKWGMRRHFLQNRFGMIYVHPWEIVRPSGANRRPHRRFFAAGNSFKQRDSFRSRIGRNRTLPRLHKLLTTYRSHVRPMGEIVATMSNLNVWKPNL